MTSEAPQDVAALRELAEKATPGPWELERWEDGWLVNGTGDYDGLIVADYSIADRDYDHTADAAYIAAANPTVVLRLLDQNDRLRSALRWAGDEHVVGTDGRREWHLNDCGYPDNWRYEAHLYPECDAARALLSLRGSGAEEATRNG